MRLSRGSFNRRTSARIIPTKARNVMAQRGLKIGVGLVGPGAIGGTFLKQLSLQVTIET